MKSFFLKLMAFAAIVVAIDVTFGFACREYRAGVSGGKTRLDEIAAHQTTAELLVFGSSRAWHHYDTRLLADSLGMTTFNCGVNSMGIEFFYPRLQQILKRYTPRMIIYDVTPFMDYMRTTTIPVTVKRLKPHFHEPEVYDMIRSLDNLEWLKSHSATYRYHGELSAYMTDDRSRDRYFDGYSPLPHTVNNVNTPKHKAMAIDAAKLEIMDRFMAMCRKAGIKLVFVLSPYYKNDMGDQSGPLRSIAARHSVPVLDYFNDAAFINDSTLFRDASHMDSLGADRFTRVVIGELKKCER